MQMLGQHTRSLQSYYAYIFCSCGGNLHTQGAIEKPSNIFAIKGIVEFKNENDVVNYIIDSKPLRHSLFFRTQIKIYIYIHAFSRCFYLVIDRYWFFTTDTDYLHVYVPDNRYAEPIFIYCYKVNK